MDTWRLLPLQINNAFMNMAIDEAILNARICWKGSEYFAVLSLAAFRGECWQEPDPRKRGLPGCLQTVGR